MTSSAMASSVGGTVRPSALAEKSHGGMAATEAEAQDHAKFVVTSTASAYLIPAMKINALPAGFVGSDTRHQSSRAVEVRNECDRKVTLFLPQTSQVCSR
jgi:hypothetical protein